MAAAIVSGTVSSILPMTKPMTQLRWPFIGAEALAVGAMPERAMRKQYQPLYPGVYIPRGVEPTARVRAEAAWLWSKREGVISGLAASAAHGAKWVADDVPIDLNWANNRRPRGIVTTTAPSA